MKLVDIAFMVFFVTALVWLLWEFIPDHTKKWWGYILQMRKEYKANNRRRYSFTWRIGRKD